MLDEETTIHLLIRNLADLEKRTVVYSWLELRYRPKLKELLFTLDDKKDKELFNEGILLLIQVIGNDMLIVLYFSITIQIIDP